MHSRLRARAHERSGARSDERCSTLHRRGALDAAVLVIGPPHDLSIYALVIYPLVGRLAGHAYPRIPTFGLPCPTTIFTLGMLLLARRPVPWSLFVIPIGWSFVGAVAALELGVPQDLALPAAALIALVTLVLGDPDRGRRVLRGGWFRRRTRLPAP